MKSKIWFMLFVLTFMFGVCWIHPGLGLMTLGLCFLWRSYLDFEKEEGDKND